MEHGETNEAGGASQLFPRDTRTPINVATRCLSALDDLFAEMVKAPEGEFLDYIFKEMWDDKTTNGDKEKDDFFEAVGKDSKEALDVALLYAAGISCAYCVQAMKAELAERKVEGWTYIADAEYWLGLVLGTWTQMQHPANPSINQVAKLGADARHRENRRLRSVALDHYEKHKSQYRSMDAAAEKIAGEVVSVTFRTVRDWIAAHNKKTRSASKP